MVASNEIASMLPLSSKFQNLTFQDYQARAAKTDRTRTQKPISFLLLGLFGEVGTLMDEVKKKQRDARSYLGYEGSVVEELGDVLWYLANIADRSGLALSAIARQVIHGSVSSYSDPGPDLTISSVQAQQLLPLQAPTPEFERTLLCLVSEIGVLANQYNPKGVQDWDLGFQLSSILSLLIQAATDAGVTLAQAAHENLQKIYDRWPTNPQFPPLFDDKYPPEEQLPRTMEVDIYERTANQKQYVLQRLNGVFIGDRVTDNILEPDDYRFHDVFHYSYAAVLGWSPVIRALLRLKRKSSAKIDEAQDGARAGLIEEGVSTFIFAYAKQLDFFEGQEPGDLSFTLLKRVKEFVEGYEVSSRPIWLWEKAILDGYRAFRFLRTHRRARVKLDLIQRTIEVSTLP